MDHQAVYVPLRNAVLARHFALGRFWRANLFTNANVLGEVGEREFGASAAPAARPCFQQPCVPRRPRRGRRLPRIPVPLYREVDDPEGGPGHGQGDYPNPVRISDAERWRVWNHDRGNALSMTGLRAIQLCVEHRLGQPVARRVVKLMLQTTGALFKWPADSPFGGYVLRWDPATDDDWQLEVDGKGRATPTLPCRWPLNPDLKGFGSQRYLYCIPLRDPRYDTADRDRFRRYEPSKDEYLGLLTAYLTVFNTFSSDASQEGRDIITMVTDQTRRVAGYLQRFGYLLVRPARGVTIRGCGEVLPLLEFPFNRVFQRILGDEFRTDAGGPFPRLRPLSRYQEAFNDALGLDPLDPTAPKSIEYTEAVDNDPHGQEALVGLAVGNLPRGAREAAFEAYLARPGTGIADGFKPYLALLLLGTDADGTRARYLGEYLAWYHTTFAGTPPVPDLVNGPYDWALAGAVALLVARALNDPRQHDIAAQVERGLETMARQIAHLSALSGSSGIQPIAVSGASTTPLGHAEGGHCAATPLRLATEVHDKNGNWYGYMPVVALAWQCLLDGGPNPFGDLSLPAPGAVASWPAPVVPAAVIRAAHTDRMPVPLAAISASSPHPAADSPDLRLFDDNSPAKPSDNEIGKPPDPQGREEFREFRGGPLPTRHTWEVPYPALVASAADAPFWRPVPAFRQDEATLVKSHRFWFESGNLKVEVELRAVQVSVRLGQPPSTTYARLAGTYSLSWVRQ